MRVPCIRTDADGSMTWVCSAGHETPVTAETRHLWTYCPGCGPPRDTWAEAEQGDAIGLLRARLLYYQDAGIGRNDYGEGVINGLKEAIATLEHSA